MTPELIPIEAPVGEVSICSRLKLSRSTVMKEIGSGRLKTVRVGSRRLTTEQFLAEYIESLVS